MGLPYNCTFEVDWGNKNKWTLPEMKFEGVHKDWHVLFSERGAKAVRTFSQAPTEAELVQLETELKQVVVHLREALDYLMDIHIGDIEPKPSVKTMITGPGLISAKAPLRSGLSWTVASSLPPSVSAIQDFWLDLEKNPIYKKAVNGYLNALAANSETELAAELYKVLEIFEIRFHGEQTASDESGYSLRKWKLLKRNLNWGKRHIMERYREPALGQSISTGECLAAVKGIIEKFRG